MQKFGYILLVGVLGLSWASFGHVKHSKVHGRAHSKFVSPGSGGGSDGGAVCTPPHCCNDQAPCPSKDKPHLKFCMGNSETQNGHCVECKNTIDCRTFTNAICVNNECVVQGMGCNKDSDCKRPTPYFCLSSDSRRKCKPRNQCVASFMFCPGARTACTIVRADP